MMLGRECRLPVDLTNITVEEEEKEDPEDYAASLRSHLQQAYKRAKVCISRSARHQKKNYDRKANSHGLQTGQFVWLHDPKKKKGVSPKLQLRWKGPYLIVTQLSDVVFRIQSSPRAKPMVVHSDRLKPYEGERLATWTWGRPQPAPETTGDDSAPLSQANIDNENGSTILPYDDDTADISPHNDISQSSPIAWPERTQL